MKLWVKNLILIGIVAVIALVPLYLLTGSEFMGADSIAQEAITQIDANYTAWFNPIFEPASGEIECLFFSLQAGIGAFVIGIILGRITSKRKDT